jgi:hypothetical protein
MNEEEIDALIATEVSLASYLGVVLGETDNLYAPEDSTIAARLRFIGETLESMI